MNIAIFGNGKMGKLIAIIARKRGHKIIASSDNKNPATSIDLKNVDVAIDFSTPESAFKNIMHAIDNNTPVVSGTTDWLEKYDNVKKACLNSDGAFLYSSNFSIGMNMLFKINKKLASLIQAYDYESLITETHHLEKLDSPSGTAITLQEDLKIILNKKTEIKSNRINDIIGTHKVVFSSKIDDIEIKHTAKSRDGFALGAIIAAEWILDKKGVYSIEDIF
ncbi:MAG: 4-hydroxy-tetrahydrodipicolinate reductase [Flavobacteriales bacterium]|jgi:4-hydroxy-tetrahydrodipicolinate reductase|nr:4-hydroxy-tetrahydrodipicolinate reductase [Flavobacteriales bacterium]|tara:strand:- start:16081 stop:16743 length:663 start_codon:yes stop_codon:yes gene_type:complete